LRADGFEKSSDNRVRTMNEVEDADEMLLAARDLSLRRGDRIVVAGVTLFLKRRRSYLLRGANGSGKTSLLRAFAGFLPPASGSLERDAHGSAYLGHADGVKSNLTGRENIRFWGELFGASAGAEDDAICALGAAPLLERRAADLSAGQRRRLALCRIALSGRPLWLLDEPTAGMDAASLAAALALVAAHCTRGGAAVIATHEFLPFQPTATITLASA
jgi:heme exporter protein A